MPRKNKSEHYVNNREFLDAIVEYKKAIAEAAEKGEPKPRITNYLGECFLKIATHLSYKPNFVNYIFKDDMISDGVENCIQYIHNFNPEKSQNPFGSWAASRSLKLLVAELFVTYAGPAASIPWILGSFHKPQNPCGSTDCVECQPSTESTLPPGQLPEASESLWQHGLCRMPAIPAMPAEQGVYLASAGWPARTNRKAGRRGGRQPLNEI